MPLANGDQRESPYHTGRRGSDGLCELKPEISSRAGCVFLMIFGVIWNAITWSFVISMLKSSGGIGFELLFAAPFVLVGLGVVAGAFYMGAQGMRWKGTVVRGTSPIRPGDTFEYQARFGPSTPAVFLTFKTAILCEESVTYRVGTDTRHESKVVYEAPLDSAENVPRAEAEQAFGSGAVVFPADAMHTFKSSNNKLRWFFQMTIGVSGPDLKGRYEIEVLPEPGGEGA